MRDMPDMKSVVFALTLALASSTALAQPAAPVPMHPIATLSAPVPAAAPAAPVAVPSAPAAPVAPAPPTPIKPPSFEIIDRGDTVEVVAHNLKAARTAIVPIRSRLQIPVVAGPGAKRIVPDDATVKLVELDTDDATHMLSVKLGFERADVKTLSRFAQVIQVGDDLHVLVPRKLPDGAAPRIPEPTVPPALAAAVAKLDAKVATRPEGKAETKPDAKPDAKIAATTAARSDAHLETKLDGSSDAKRDATSIDAAADAKSGATREAAGAKPVASGDPALDAPADAATAAKLVAGDPRTTAATDAAHDAARPAKLGSDGKPLRQVLAPEPDDAWSKIAMYAALGLATAGAGVWLMRRRRTQLAAPASIEVIAQRSLGGKARIVWLSVGPREMIVSVTAQQVRMLSQWRKADTAAALPAAYTHESRVEPRNEPVDDRSGVVEKPLSPAVSGILRLRGRTGQMPAVVPEEIATDDVVADQLWAKEILAATGARR